jgi:methyltransferase family protein
VNAELSTDRTFDGTRKDEAWDRKSPTGEWPPPPDSYETALLDIFKGFPPGKVLDVPCGIGQMSVRFRDMGHDAACFDLAPEEFDYLLCKNGAHRVFALDRLFSEFARILKPGGKAVVSVPNYARIQRRLNSLLYGSQSRNVNSQEAERVLDLAIANFRNCLLYPQIEKTFFRHGFSIENITSETPYSPLLLYPLVLLVRFFCLFASKKKREDFSLEGANSKHAIAGGRHIIVVASLKES